MAGQGVWPIGHIRVFTTMWHAVFIRWIGVAKGYPMFLRASDPTDALRALSASYADLNQ